jgi:hypothetical protein
VARGQHRRQPRGCRGGLEEPGSGVVPPRSGERQGDGARTRCRLAALRPPGRPAGRLLGRHDLDRREGRRSAAGRATTPAASPKASPGATSTAPLPTRRGAILGTTELASGRVLDWDARWDETGTRLAVWIADDSDPKVGKLTLFEVDPDTGDIRAEKALHDVRALAGFSIGKGRLAWATPRGQDAKGSRVQVVAWTKDAVGSAESQGSEGEVVVIR